MSDAKGKKRNRQSQVGHSPVPPLPEDNDPPFSAPRAPSPDAAVDTDIQMGANKLDSTHQATDTNIEEEEVYDEGLSGAAEADEPNAGNTVANYNPDKDSRKKT